MATCEDIVKQAVDGNLTDQEIDTLLKELRKVKRSLEAEGKLGEVEQKIKELTLEMLDDIEIAKIQQKRNFYRNIMVENRLMAIMDEADRVTGKPSKGLFAILGGINDRFQGALASIDAGIIGTHKRAMGEFVADLEKANLLTAYKNMKGDFERQVTRALAEMNGAKNVGEYSDEAKQIAEIMSKAQEKMRRKKNVFGAYVKKKQGYIVRQTHNREKMIGKRDEWKANIRDKLDYDKMGVPKADIEEFLNSAWIAITTGIRKQVTKNGVEEIDEALDVTDTMFKYAGPGNLAKKLSHHRLLEFKSPDDWYDYDQEFGNKSLGVSFQEDIRSGARDISLMQALGTNPKAMLDRVIKRAEEKYRNDPKKLASFSGGKKFMLEALYKEVSGEIDIPQNELAARIGRNIRAIQTMAKLGGSVISAFSDIAAFASTRQFQGRNFFQSWMDAFQAPLKGLSPGDADKYLRSVGIGIDGLLGDFTARFSAGDEIQGQTSKLMQLYFKVNLLQPWTDANKRAIGQMLSHDFAQDAGLSFDKLNTDRKNLFEIYGIDAERWDVIRASVGKAADGNEYILPENMKVPSTGRFSKMTATAKERYLEETRQMITSVFINEADIAVPTPGARERAIIRLGQQPGTPLGESLRFIMQFKSFAITVMTRVMGRQLRGYGAGSSRGMVGLASFIAASSMLGLISYQSKQMLKGREPRELNAKTIMAGILQGGGAGIYGDFLFAEYNRFGGGPLETLAGPTAGTFFDALELVQKTGSLVMDGEFEFSKVGPEGLNLIKSNTPFMNLFYTKQTMDYLIFHHLQEMMRPGYLSRHERTLKREYDQEYFIPPSSYIKRGGGFE